MKYSQRQFLKTTHITCVFVCHFFLNEVSYYSEISLLNFTQVISTDIIFLKIFHKFISSFLNETVWNGSKLHSTLVCWRFKYSIDLISKKVSALRVSCGENLIFSKKRFFALIFYILIILSESHICTKYYYFV